MTAGLHAAQPDLSAWMAEVERQLRELATGNQLNHAIVELPNGGGASMADIAAAPSAIEQAQESLPALEQRVEATIETADELVSAATAAYDAAAAAELTSLPPADEDATAAQQAAHDAAQQARQALVDAQAAAFLGVDPQQAATEAWGASEAARLAAGLARTEAAAADAAAAAAAAAAAQAVANAVVVEASLEEHPTNVATGAMLLANGRNRVIPWPTPPTAPAGAPWVDGDMWIDTANDRRINVWDSTQPGGWVPQLLSTGALTQIVASDVIVQNSVVAELIAADAITAKHTITGALVQTAPFGSPLGRCTMDQTGFTGYSPAGVQMTKVGTDGRLVADEATLRQATVTGLLRTDETGARMEMAQELLDTGAGNVHSVGRLRFFYGDPAGSVGSLTADNFTPVDAPAGEPPLLSIGLDSGIMGQQGTPSYLAFSEVYRTTTLGAGGQIRTPEAYLRAERVRVGPGQGAGSETAVYLEAPTTVVDGVLRIPNSEDLSETSSGHGLQIGADTGQHLAADHNEIGSRVPGNSSTGTPPTWSNLILWNPTAGGPQGTAAGHLTRRDFVEGDQWRPISNMTLGSNWTHAGNSSWLITGGICHVRVYLTSPSNWSMTADASGNIADTNVCTLPTGLRPGVAWWGIWGREGFFMIAGASIYTTGQITLRSWGPNRVVEANTTFAFQFSYPLV